MADYQTFEEIWHAVCVGVADSQYAREAEVKAVVNMVYLNEICQCDDLYPLFWLLDTDDAKKSKAPVTAITAITKATPPVVTSIAHGLATGDLVTFYDVVGAVELNYNTFHVTRVSADTFSLQTLDKSNYVGLTLLTAAGTSGKAHHRGTLLTSCRRVLHANWHGYDKALIPLSPAEVADYATWLDESTSRPLRMQHRKVFLAAGGQYDYLLWYQAADAAYNLHIQCEKQPARLSATTDVPLGPPQVADAIIAGSVMRLGENKTQLEAGVVWPSIYKSNIAAIRSMNREWWEQNKPSERSPLFLV